MYRSRKRSQPKIPSNAIQLSDLLPTTAFGKFHKTTVSLNDQTALIFFSDTIFDLIPQMNDIQFDGTFTMFRGNSTNCGQFFFNWQTLLTCYPLSNDRKGKGLYECILESIRNLIPQFKPTTCMSDWEIAVKSIFLLKNLPSKYLNSTN